MSQALSRLKQHLVRHVHRGSLKSGVSTTLATRQPVMRIVMVHGVGDAEYPARVFEDQIRYLRRRFTVVPLERIVGRLERSSRAAGEVALTFDDGLRNHYTVVYPILKRHDLPATFFVCPGLIEQQRWIWSHEARARLWSLDPPRRAGLAGAIGFPTTDVESLICWMKTLSLERRTAIDEAIRSDTPGFRPTDDEREMCDPMTWQELQALDPRLITVGSHTLTHPNLPSLSPLAVEQELKQSRALLETRLDRPTEMFCYPNGSVSPSALACARATYRGAVSTVEGFVSEGDDLHLLSRINAPANLPTFAWRLHRPSA